MKQAFTSFTPLVCACMACMLAACGHGTHPAAGPAVAPATAAPSAAAPAAQAPVARARLLTTGGQPSGLVSFAPAAGGVELTADAQGLTPGAHGLHIHEKSACAPGPDAASGKIVDFGAAGGHFDPGNSRNHGRPNEDPTVAHAGELPALQADAGGRAQLRHVNANVSLDRGDRSVMGRTVVVHADPDDYASDPAGNSGARVLCGVIEPVAPGPVKARATLEGTHVYPEGIAIDPRSGDAYVGSSSNGDLFRIRPGAAQGELLQAGGAMGRQGAFGMKLDAQGRLWVAGGPNGTLAVVDPASAQNVAMGKVPQDVPSFLNDLAIARDGTVYVTDSFRPVLWRVRPAADGKLKPEPWLDLANSPIRYRPNEINLNGIVVSPDGRQLLAIQLATGMLWRIDTASRAVAQVAVEGGELRNGDGLLLAGASDLYVVRNADQEVLRLRLASDWRSARVEQRLTDARLRYPTTAALGPAGLQVVNSQLDRQKRPPPLLPFDVVTIEVPR